MWPPHRSLPLRLVRRDSTIVRGFGRCLADRLDYGTDRMVSRVGSRQTNETTRSFVDVGVCQRFGVRSSWFEDRLSAVNIENGHVIQSELSILAHLVGENFFDQRGRRVLSHRSRRLSDEPSGKYEYG